MLWFCLLCTFSSAEFSGDGSTVFAETTACPEAEYALRAVKTYELVDVNDMALAPMRKLLAIATGWVRDKGSITIVDIEKQEVCRCLKGHEVGVACVTISHDEKVLVSADYDGVIIVWDMMKDTPLQVIKEQDSSVDCIKFAPDDKLFATCGSDRSIRIWESSTGKLLRTLKGHENVVNALEFSSKGNLLASGGEDKLVIVWDVETGKKIKTLEGHKDRVSALLFDENSDLLISGGREGTIKFWETKTWTETGSVNGHAGPGGVWSLCWIKQGSILISSGCSRAKEGDGGEIAIWDLSKKRVINTYLVHELATRRVAVLVDSKLIITAGNRKPKTREATVKIWSYERKK